MRANQAHYLITTMCRVLGASTSGYHAWRSPGLSWRQKEDEVLTRRTRAIHARSRGTYGAPRAHADLAADGVRMSRKRVARLMRQAGLAGVSQRKGPIATIRQPGASVAPDLVPATSVLALLTSYG